VTPAISLEFPVVTIAQQRVVVRIRLDVNARAVSAIAPGRTPMRHKLLPAKCNATIAAIAGLQTDFSFVYKHVVSNCLDARQAE
jgi:hypothetical protein